MVHRIRPQQDRQDDSGGRGHHVPAPNDANNPYGITVGPDGNLWFTELSSAHIGKITVQGTVTEYALPENSYAWGITAGPDGNLWFTAISTVGYPFVGKITPRGEVTTYPVYSSSWVFEYSTNTITTDPDGNLWFTGATDQVGRITPQGVVTIYPTPTQSPSLDPTDVTTGPDGNLWFADDIGNGIDTMTIPSLRTGTSVALQLSKTSIVFGHEQAAKLNVTVTPRFSGSAPTGSVVVNTSNSKLCSIKLSTTYLMGVPVSGHGSCKLTVGQLEPGTHRLKATYLGTMSFGPATSPQVSLKIVAE